MQKVSISEISCHKDVCLALLNWRRQTGNYVIL